MPRWITEWQRWLVVAFAVAGAISAAGHIAIGDYARAWAEGTVAAGTAVIALVIFLQPYRRRR